MADIDTNTIADDLVSELNLDPSELATIRTLVTTAKEVVSRSADASSDDSLTVPAIKALATQMYYDRALTDGMSKGILMMLTHLQANPQSSQSGDSNGN